jgi:hypothetical protein
MSASHHQPIRFAVMTTTLPSELPMAATQYEEGYVTNNDYLHAAQRSLSGHCATCGAGKIINLTVGRFDPVHLGACPTCANLTARLYQRSG